MNINDAIRHTHKKTKKRKESKTWPGNILIYIYFQFPLYHGNVD